MFTKLIQKLKLEKLFFSLLFLVLATLPFGIAALTNLSLISLALIGVFGLKKEEWKATLRDPISLSFAAFFIVYLLSLSYTCNLEGGLRQLETKMSFLIAAPVLRAYQARFSEMDLLKLLKSYIFGVLATLVFMLIYASYRSFLAGSFSYLSEGGTYYHYYFLYESFAEPIMHPGYFSLYIGLALLGSIYLIKSSVWTLKKFMPILLTFGLGLLLLQGRMTIIALFLSLGLWLVNFVIKRNNWKPLIISSFILLILALLTFKIAPKSLSDRYLAFPDFSYDISGSNFNSATYRLAEWRCAWDAVKDAPLIGYGIGCGQQELFKRYEEFEFWEGLERQYNAHNQYLETMLNTGTLGLISLVIMLITILSTAVKNNNYFAIYALIFFALSLATESMLERAWAVILFNVFFPLFTSLRKH